MSISPDETQSTPLLEVRDLVKTFHAVRAVDRISFTIQQGQTVSLIGPNGSGKTCTINLISGVLRPTSGQVFFEGKRISGSGPEHIAEHGIARTFQNGRVFGNMSVRDNVLIGMHTHLEAARPFAFLRHIPILRWVSLLAETGMAIARPPSVRREEQRLLAKSQQQLERFGERLLPREEKLAYTLSYANRRRIEIARGLALRPRLLLLDEPTAGMNPSETAEMLEQLLKLRAEGQTILLVEHKLDLVMKLSDHVLVMDGGKLIAQGPPDMVQEDERVTEAYIGRRRSFVRDVQKGVTLPQIPDQELDKHVPGSPVLELKAIDAYYGSAQALHNVSLHVKEGEIVCLLGGNASGKSTTMKVLLGLLQPRAGEVLLDNKSIACLHTPDIIRRGVASVPEARRIFRDMTIEENLRVGAYLRRGNAAIKQDMQRIFELFPRLAERRRQLGGSLSGGEQQMLAFARALMSNPRLICMDEPTMGLAPVFVERVLDTIVAMNRMGVTIFMVEQNAELALSIASRGYVLQSGRLVLEGAARDLLNNPTVREAYLGQNTIFRRS